MNSELFTAVPLTPLRKVIAARMTEAKQGIPHYRVAMDIELDAVLAARKTLNEDLAKSSATDGQPTQKVSVNDFVIKACATALMEVPDINVQFIDDCLHQYSQADISVVVAVPGGLSTPILRHANRKTLLGVSSEVKTLADRALNGQLKMTDIVGGSFSISNLGMYGVDQFDAIINPPQCGILAVGSAKPQAVVKDGEIGVATIMRVNLSLDHCAIDGATGAKFLKVLRDLLQNPVVLIEGKGSLDNAETEA